MTGVPVHANNNNHLNDNANNDGDSDDWIETVKVFDNGEIKNLQVKLDPGAQANVLPKKIFDKFNFYLERSNATLTGYGGADIPVLGKTVFKCQLKNGTYFDVTFHVVETNDNSPPVFSKKTCVALKLVERIHTVENNVDNNANLNEELLNDEMVFNRYASLFEGIGNINYDYDVKLNPDKIPYVAGCRNFPFKMLNPLKK